MFVVISGVRSASTLDTCDDEPPVALPEAHGEPELPDASPVDFRSIPVLSVS
jgi:hypothetical protein